ncbi:O-antigen ligase family protein [Sulfitobacter sp. SH22]|uniref:O-antigen ligase family protein n=1 Tax=Sulfitobacter sp. SH22 TaxID=3421172 RepID=UPI003F507997
MKIRMPSKYVLLGTSLALMLQTNYRLAGPVGAGELLAVAFIFLKLAKHALSDRTMFISRPDTLTLQYIGIVCLIVIPMTLLSSTMNVPGTSIRDLFAYVFVGAILLVLPQSNRDMRAMIVAFLFVAYATIIIKYLVGGSSAYYFSRFSGGAKNPNQLGLYLIASVCMVAYLPNLWARVGVISVAMFFGLASMSDAFLAAAFGGFSVLVMLRIFSPRAVLYLMPAVLLIGHITLVYSGLLDTLSARWAVADEGGARTVLYLSAIQAWSDSVFSMLFGYGAGSFAGFDGPFQGAEAHNTILDLATIAGIFGFFLFPLKPIWLAMNSLSKKLHFVPAVLAALIAFGLFHFIGRQPIFWVALVIIARITSEAPKPKTLVVQKTINSKPTGA